MVGSAISPRQEWLGIMPSKRPKAKEDPGVLARILYRLRAESGMTQVQVAIRAGWTPDNSRYSNFERGATKLPSEKLVADLERAFGTEPGFIENQLPRRDKFMLQDPPEPEPQTIPSSVIDFPHPRIRMIVERLKHMATHKDGETLLIQAEMQLLTLEERFISKHEETAGGSGQEDTERGTNVPSA